MREVQVIKYQAEDGKSFDTEEKCLEYEKRLLQVKEILNLIPVIKRICAENGVCSLCPFYREFGCGFGDGENAPYHWSL